MLVGLPINVSHTEGKFNEGRYFLWSELYLCNEDIATNNTKGNVNGRVFLIK